MRAVQNGIANNFGLVGKNIRRYLTTTALTATGLMAIATPALADGSWSNFEVLSGEQTVTTPDVNTTNIEVHTMDATVRGDADIAALDTVNLNQLSNKSKYVVFDIKSDPTKIMGKLNANGRVYIFDQNGVIFGEGSEVNVGGIVASTGHISQTNLDADKIKIEDVGTSGEVVNNGKITVSEGGLAAFVAPSVRNNGIINAKAGTVALASGNTVTLDLYGDGLVSVAADGELANAIVENKGTINASGGNVALTVAAAKDAVDSVVNMDGIINVSSKTGKGGKVSIDGGKKGVVKVSGTIEANGLGGGDISVKGQNIHLTETSVLSVDADQHGNGGTVGIVADNAAIFRGRINARGGDKSGNGGFIDTSAYGYLGLGGTVDTSALNGLFGTWLIDPLDFEIRLGTGDTIGDGDVVNLNTTWLPSGENGFGDAISYIYESEIEGQNTSFILRAQRNITVSGTSSDSMVQLQPGRSLTLETQNGAGNAGSINLTGSTHGNNLLFKTTGAGSININGSTTGTSSSDVVLSKLETGAGGVNVTTGNGQIFVNGAIVTANGAVNMTASNRIFVDNDISTNGGVANFTATTFTTDDTNPAGSPDNLDQIKTSGGNVKIVADNVNLGETAPIQAQTIIDAGTGNVMITRKSAGSIGLGGATGGTNINDQELAAIKAGSLNIGDTNAGDNKVNAIYVDSVNTAANITGRVTLSNYLNQTEGVSTVLFGDTAVNNNNVIFFGANKFNGLTVNANDHIIVFNTAKVESATGDIVFNADANAQSVGGMFMGGDSSIDTNGFNFTFNGHQAMTGVNVKIDAEGGNILLNNDDVFAAFSPDSLVTKNSGTITLNQWDKSFVDNGGSAFSAIGSVQNAVNAVQNTGTGKNTIIVGEGTYDESVTVAEDNFLIRSRLNYNVNPNTGVRGAESIIDPMSPGFLITGDNVEINGMYITGATGLDGYGVKLDGAVNTDLLNNIINGTSQQGIYAVGNTNKDITISNNKIDNTGADGIFIKTTDNKVVIGNNKIGTLNINSINDGSGIKLQDVAGADVFGNTITNVDEKTTASDDGHGIYLLNTQNAKVGTNGANTISYVDKDGVKIVGGQLNEVKGNNISFTTREGIFAQATKKLNIFGNTISDVLDSGIARAGIFMYKTVGDINVEDNTITRTGQGVKFDLVTGLNNKITHNTITDVKEDGVNVTNSSNVLINRNIIKDTGHNGITLSESNGLLQVLKNEIGDSTGVTKINGNGIYLFKIDTADVKGNNVTHVTTNENDSGHGIYLLRSKNIKVGGPSDTDDRNTISYVEKDGVKSVLGDMNRIENNNISYTGREGVFAQVEKNLTVIKNNISHVLNAGIARAGVFVFRSENIHVEENVISDAGIGVKFDLISGVGNNISRNIISDIKEEGINVTNSSNITINNNDIDDTGSDGIYAYNITKPLTIHTNDIDDVGGDGIEVKKFETVDIYNNDVRDAEDNGMLVHFGDYAHIHDNLGLDGTENGISYVGKNGIFVDNVDNSDIVNNEIEEAGWDGIHVSNFITTFIGTNLIDRSGDDGIEAHNGHEVVINGNIISESGVGTVIDDGDEEEYEEYGGYDEFFGGHDGIHVRNIYGASEVLENDDSEVFYKSLATGYAPGIVRITNNQVTVLVDSEEAESNQLPGVNISGDDGIEVVNVEGYVYIVGNNVANSGVGTDGVPFGLADDYYGADGIHVRDVFLNDSGYNIYDHYQSGDIGNGEYNIVVSNNVINNSLDDGVEIIGTGYNYGNDSRVALVEEGPVYGDKSDHHEGVHSYNEGYYWTDGNTGRVLVSGNNITNSGWGSPSAGYGQSDSYFSGGDGIHVRGVYPGYSPVVVGLVEGDYQGYAVDVLGNTVNNSGDDGIDVEYSSSTLISGNTVTNSGWESAEIIDGFAPLVEGGYESGADWYGADGIFVNNIGGYGRIIMKPTISEVSDFPGDGYIEYSVVVRDNDVDNSLDDGIQVNNDMLERYSPYEKSLFSEYYNPYTAPVLIGGPSLADGNTVTDSGFHGLYISGVGHDDVIVSGNAFTNFDTGGTFESGVIDFTAPVGNTWTNGKIGLRFSPIIIGYTEGEGGDPIYAHLDLVDDDAGGSTPYPAIPTNFGGTIGKQTFTGFKEEGDFYVYLDDGAFTNDGTPIWLNGLNSNYDGIQPSLTGGLLSEDDYNYLEARFRHFPDAGASSTDIFWFGYFVPDDAALPPIEQSLIFNRFNVFNGDATGLNVRIVSLPTTGAGGGAPTPSLLNGIGPFAGNNATDASSLNQIETAAGGDGQPNPTQLNNIEAAAGTGEEQPCWGNAVAAASGGQVVNVVYTGGFSSNLDQAAACGTGF